MADKSRGPGDASPGLAESVTARRTDTPKGTPHLARLSWNGHPGMLSTYARRRGWLDPDLARLLRDPEAGALAIFDTIGRQRARRLALLLLELGEEVAS